ncbi:sarcosine oxidase subunit alpha, partial [Aromatoleum toluclasticum]|nr:sarcosine oxidase subunit alpha [Aromatoleum toluclasticum]
IIPGSAVIEANGKKRVTGAQVARIDIGGFKDAGRVETLSRDTNASSGGYSPVVHLAAHTGARPEWRDELLGFVPGMVPGMTPVGGVHGKGAISDALADGAAAGVAAAQ